jgi:hypothetical protein
MPWQPPEIPTDQGVVTDRTLDGMSDRMDGWVPVEGAGEVALAEEIGREIAVLNQNTVAVLELAVAGMGETVFTFPAFLGSTATIAVDLVVTVAGTLVPQGFQVVGTNSDGTEVTFQLLADVTTGGTTATVTMHATEAGYAANDVPAGPLTIVVATPTIVSADAAGPSVGGVDPETVQEYLDRFVDYVGTLRPGAVRADDVTALARSVTGVHRAFALDLYDPAAPAEETERTVTVFCVDEDGLPVPSGVADAVAALLADSREVNFVFHVADPTFTQLEIEYTAVAELGADPDVVEVGVNAAVETWLSKWGSTVDDDSAWVAGNVVRYLQVAQVIGSVPGVAYLDTVTINGAAEDFPLPGVAPLPTSPIAAVAPSTVTGTVTG